MMVSRIRAVFSSSYFFIVLFVLGTTFLGLDAFHGNVWFDESYSIAIANHSFAEIWRIGASDVHPVLFYWALHILELIFGQNILIYRLFAVLGSCALALLGYTHIRKDFGWKVGLLFTFFAFFTPYVVVMAPEIRMYSWVTFTVTLCLIYALRILRKLKASAPSDKETSLKQEDTAPEDSSKVPLSWWIIFACSSLASAYLHYFGVLSAFMINVILLIFLLRNLHSHKSNLLVFSGLACVQVLLYLPWLFVLISQLGVVSNTYWVHFVFPTTLIDLITYPLAPSEVSFAMRGLYGTEAQVLIFIALIICLGALLAIIVRAIMRTHTEKVRELSLQPVDKFRDSHAFRAALYSLAVYGGVLILASLISYLASSYLLYSRYLFVAIGPLLLACAILIVRFSSRLLLSVFCAGLLGVACITQSLAIADNYDPSNRAPLQYFEKLTHEYGTGDLSQTTEAATTNSNEKAPQTIEPIPVLSSDIGVEGVTAVTYRNQKQLYLDWQPGNWGLAYKAYAPTLTSIKSWDDELSSYSGTFILMGQSPDGSRPQTFTDVEEKYHAHSVKEQTFPRPYERTYFTIALMEI